MFNFLLQSNVKLNEFVMFGDDLINIDLSGCRFHDRLPIIEVYEKLFNDKEKKNIEFVFCGGGQFMVSKEKILSKPREFYLKIVKLLDYDINPIEGFVIERFNDLIFNLPL